MIKLTRCCNADIITKHGREYPDNSGFSIAVSVPVCECCHDERPETYEACDCCGEREAQVETILGDYCAHCADLEEVKIMEGVKAG